MVVVRRRFGAVMAAAACIVVGVSTRSLPDGLVTNFLGVACYGAMVYALVIACGPRMSLWKVAAAALVICWAVEAFQLTGFPLLWARHELFGFASRAVLGTGFELADVPAYPVGILFAWTTHMRWRREKQAAVRAG